MEYAILIAKSALKEAKVLESTHEKRGYLLEDFRLFHLRDAQGAKMDYHYHEFHKLLLLLSGSGGYAVEGKRYNLLPGDMVLIGSHCVHRPEFQPGNPYERVILYISPDFLRRNSGENCDLEGLFSGENGHVLRMEEGHRLLQIVSDLERELSGNGYGREILSSCFLLRLLVELGRELQREPQRPDPIQPRDRRILEMIGYLDEHLTENISIEDLARRFYFSKYHMMRKFRQETGTTIHAYLSDRRLLLARDHIAQGMPSTEACFQSGFGSYSAFSRAYGKRFGITPTGRADRAGVMEETYE